MGECERINEINIFRLNETESQLKVKFIVLIGCCVSLTHSLRHFFFTFSYCVSYRRTQTHTNMCVCVLVKSKSGALSSRKMFDYIETFKICEEPRPRPLKRIEPHTWHGTAHSAGHTCVC